MQLKSLTKDKIVYSLLITVVFLQLVHLFVFNKEVELGQVAGLETKYENVTVTALVGQYQYVIFGYTSPNAQVNLNGQGINEETNADTTGYFEFNRNFSPYVSREVCLSSKDEFGRTSIPVCLPPFPTQYDVSIGPVIIPPTLSLDKLDYYTGDEVVLTGQTLPDSEVNLSMFTQPSTYQLPGLDLSFLSSLKMVKPVEAFSIPKLKTESDNKGNFSLVLPSSQAQKYRLFTQVNFQEESSANSTTLSLEILPVWLVIIRFFSYIWSILGPRMLEIIILLEIVALITYFMRIFFHPYHLSKRRDITVYKSHLPVIEEKHPLMTRLNRSLSGPFA